MVGQAPWPEITHDRAVQRPIKTTASWSLIKVQVSCIRSRRRLSRPGTWIWAEPSHPTQAKAILTTRNQSNWLRTWDESSKNSKISTQSWAMTWLLAKRWSKTRKASSSSTLRRNRTSSKTCRLKSIFANPCRTLTTRCRRTRTLYPNGSKNWRKP